MVINDKTVVIINIYNFNIIQKLYCEEFSPIVKDLFIINGVFFDNLNAGLMTINGNIFVVDIFTGNMLFKTEDQNEPFFMSNLLKVGNNIVFNNQDKLISYKYIEY